jgi:hypothetical protein
MKPAVKGSREFSKPFDGRPNPRLAAHKDKEGRRFGFFLPALLVQCKRE